MIVTDMPVAEAPAQAPMPHTSRSPSPKRHIDGVVIAHFVGYGENDAPLIDFDGNPSPSPVAAVCLVQLGSEHIGRQVALQFQQGDITRPVILGLLYASVAPLVQGGPTLPPVAAANEEEVVVSAKRKLTLQCGAASISLDVDGNIEIRGENLLSRASRQNRIKGSSISLN